MQVIDDFQVYFLKDHVKFVQNFLFDLIEDVLADLNHNCYIL